MNRCFTDSSIESPNGNLVKTAIISEPGLYALIVLSKLQTAKALKRGRRFVHPKPWLVGKDVAQALGYSDTDKAIRTHVDDDDKQIFKPADLAGLDIPNRGMSLINESGLYSLVLSSKL